MSGGRSSGTRASAERSATAPGEPTSGSRRVGSTAKAAGRRRRSSADPHAQTATVEASATAGDAAGDAAGATAGDAAAAAAAVGDGNGPGLAARREGDPGQALTLWIAWTGPRPPIGQVVPALANLGLPVAGHQPVRLAGHASGPPGGAADSGDGGDGGPGAATIVDEYRLLADARRADEAIRAMGAIRAILGAGQRGEADSDAMDSLVLTAGLRAAEVGLVRMLVRFVQLAGIPTDIDFARRALTERPDYARTLVALFHARLDPGRGDPAAAMDLAADLERRLDDVTVADVDRVLRRLRDTVLATTRTTFYRGRAGVPLAVKLRPAELPWLPEPRPFAEVFVSTPFFDALHLRGAPVARGGIRASDRGEDLRAEIAGLMQAQRVKNALIVPDGAKGGFVVRRGRPGLDPGAHTAECYAAFMRALLAMTDNRDGPRLARPAGIVCHDPPDPYLVVAADKGTAALSDLANAVARERGYWLGDAFASGGRTGYDHKRLGVTARGAWEAARRHFAELGVDVDREPLTVVGIGDMSGDVFGNGLLRSRRLRLVAAFDHRHIFLDPDPDPARSHAERARLAALGASGWDDYDRRLISPGGGVHALGAKSITLSAAARDALGVAEDSLSGAGVVRAILTAPVDMMWNGGIGTWIKATAEDNLAVGDKARDAMRVDAGQVRARVVVEGGNLGLTEAARVEYCLAGGRCNTDFVDNSAGVDISDREVNLKIGLDLAVRAGHLPASERDRILAAAAADVVDLVLGDAARQVLALSVAERDAETSLDRLTRLARRLVEDGEIDPNVDRLPDDATLRRRRADGRGLTRPEIAIIHAYAKRHLARRLLASDLPDDRLVAGALDRYLPAGPRTAMGPSIDDHPLRREIIATWLTNEIVDRAGGPFVDRLAELVGASPADSARAFLITRDLFGLDGVWAAVDDYCRGRGAAPRRAPREDPAVETMLATRVLQEDSALWILRRRAWPTRIDAELARYRDGIAEVTAAYPDTMVEVGDERALADVMRRAESLAERGMPEPTARQVAWLSAMGPALEIVDVALSHDAEPADALRIYVAAGARLGLGRLADRISEARGDPMIEESHWDLLARTSLRAELVAAQAGLTRAVLEATGPGGETSAALDHLVAGTAGSRVRSVVDEVSSDRHASPGTVSVVVARLRDLLHRT